jgi:diguanylate cyclase (GGDEF)-like protein/PAS domain S-box-containing protein
MSPAELSAALSGLFAAGAAAYLWYRASRPEASVLSPYRWLALAAVLWGASLVTQDGVAAVAPATSLTPADVLSLLALPALGIGVAGLAPARPRAGQALGRLIDGCVLAAALFVIDWVALFGAEYHTAAEGVGVFALQVIHPVADLVALGAILAYAAGAGRRGVPPYLALLAMTVGDSLAVGARISGAAPGGWTQFAQLAAFCLLAATPLAGRGLEWLPRRLAGRPAAADGGAATTSSRAAGFSAAAAPTVAATAAAAIAALVAIGWALGGGRVAEPAVVVGGGVAALGLAVRTGGLLRRDRAAQTVRRESERQLRELADRIGDVVLVCDLAGTIRYASPAVREYGYAPEALTGSPVADLVHPEDVPAGIAAVEAAAAGDEGGGMFPCRIRSADGTWRHIESTISRYRDADAADRLLITARDVSDQVALRRQVTHLTFNDGLTGLPNRAYLEDRARAADTGPAGAGTVAGAIFLDLDGFTSVNDSVGHGAGDLVLAQAARRLRATVPPQHTVARWGGDEFAVLAEGAASAQEIVDIAERLAGAIPAAPFRVADRDISLTASIGVALAGRDGEDDGDGHLLRNADVAMARAKESGGGRVQVFAAHMHADVVRRLELASDLRAAIAAGGLELVYQPVIELGTARIVGAEALIRWSRGGDPVPPEDFLGVAEDCGLITLIGSWVLREACRQAAAWRGAGRPVWVSVNCSLRQVTAAGFAESVLLALDEAGLPPDALILEVTERVLIEGEGLEGGLAELRRRGVRLAIDDFGTGYASLAYLRRLPADIIKIDPSFVAGLGTDPILAMLTRTIVGVGHDLGIQVVAEGIEHPEQLELLREMGCGLGQGYLVGAPTPARGIGETGPGLGPGELGPDAASAPAPAPAG